MALKYSNLLLFLLTYQDNIDDMKNEENYKRALKECKEPFKEKLIVARKEYLEYINKEIRSE